MCYISRSLETVVKQVTHYGYRFGLVSGVAAGGKDDDAAEIDGGNRAQVCDAG